MILSRYLEAVAKQEASSTGHPVTNLNWGTQYFTPWGANARAVGSLEFFLVSSLAPESQETNNNGQ